MITRLLLMLALGSPFVSLSATGHGDVSDIAPETIADKGFDGIILDVRSAQEYNDGHIKGAINLPHTDIHSHLAGLGKVNQPILVYCRSGRRAGMALQELDDLGYQLLYHLDGDMNAWRELNLPEASNSPSKK